MANGQKVVVTNLEEMAEALAAEAAAVGVGAIVPGTGATNLGKAEDGAHTSGDVGVMALGIQKATPADISTEGDYTPVQVSAGRLWTSDLANIKTIKTTITRPADTNAYASNDTFATSTSAPTVGGSTLTSAARASGGTGKITDAVITYSTPTVPVVGELWIFDQAVTAVNDNAAFAVSTADVLNLVGIIPFTISDLSTPTQASYVTGLDIRFTCVGTANLRFLVKILTGYTPAASDVLGILVHIEN